MMCGLIQTYIPVTMSLMNSRLSTCALNSYINFNGSLITYKKWYFNMILWLAMNALLFLYFSHKNRTVCWRYIRCNRWQIACIESSQVYSSWVRISLTYRRTCSVIRI